MHSKISELTTIILTKNSEATVRKTLGSVSWSGHILVADDGSTDRTLQIVKECGASKVKLTSTTSFADKRNEAMRYAPTEWVFFVDSDEWVSEQLRNSIFTFFTTNQHQQTNGMNIKRTDFFFGKKLLHGETADMHLLRLAKKSEGKWQRSVHETWQVQGNVGTLEGELYHAPHPSVESFLDKINAYTEIEAVHRLKKQGQRGKGKDVFPFTLYALPYYLQLLIYPPVKFLLNYLFKLGFLDGYRGLIMAWMMSLHSLCVRIKVLEKMCPKRRGALHAPEPNGSMQSTPTE